MIARGPLPSEPTQVLRELEAVYRAMLVHADAREWEAMVALEGRRSDLVHNLGRVPPADPVHRDALERLRQLNADLERQVVAGRSDTLAALTTFRQGRRMRQTYGQVAAGSR